MVQSVPPRAHPRDQMREERLEILGMLEAGGISVEEAATLLEALDRAAEPPVGNGAAPRPAEGRQVRIRVTDRSAGKALVNLAFPVGLVGSGLDIASQFVPEYLPTVEAIRESVGAGFRGSLLDVDDGGQRVEIIVE